MLRVGRGIARLASFRCVNDGHASSVVHRLQSTGM
jgi:hypothetical protein